MPDDPRILELLEEALESERTPEEVCAHCPDLLGEVRQRWQRCRSVEAQIAAMFPPSGPIPPSYGAPPPVPEPELPRIPGYEVQSVLGRGGMGVVYRARHLRLNRTVALKMLLSGQYASAPELLRFTQEAEAVAGLRHPHIVQVHDVGDHEGRPYFTMAFLEGGSLAERLAGVPQPAEQAAAMMATLAGAVHAAHRGGIIHRDLKPGNILLTADGTPCISDFGLARRFEGSAALTLAGARVGTPSYMAPEQATGKAGAVGPAADVYALGAILYEMLTGRPPFRSESPAETERQLLADEPVAPSRLNAKVPRDLETICLKCLRKDPQRRYGSAAALAEDLGRFQRGEPIEARPAGAAERVGKWARRRPAVAAVIACGAALAGTLIGGGLWIASERAAVARAVEDDLREVQRFHQTSCWGDAAAALERAKARVSHRGMSDVRQRLNRASHDLALASRLDAIALHRAAIVDGRVERPFDKPRADAAYAAAFREAGLADWPDDAAVVAERVKTSNIRPALLAALDDWALCAADPRKQTWLLDVARRADPDPSGWRDRARDAGRWNDPAALAELAKTAPAANPPVRMLMALGERLQSSGADAVPFLRQVQQAHPADFWSNFTLGDALRKTSGPEESVRYYQAALAIRSQAPVAHGNLGLALSADARPEEAISHFRQAVSIDPAFAHGHYSLGLALKATGQLAEAIAHFRHALRLEPDNADAHYNLGLALAMASQREQAVAQFREALRIDPRHGDAHYNLGLAMSAKGALDEAIAAYQRALEVDPASAYAHYNLGLALNTRGDADAAIRHFRRAIDLLPRDAHAHYNLALALKARSRVREAVIHFEQALAIDPKQPDAHYNLALALKDMGRLAEATEHYQQTLQLAPAHPHAHAALGEALLVQGRLREARAALRRGLELVPSDHPQRAQYVSQLQRCDARLAAEGPTSADTHDAP